MKKSGHIWDIIAWVILALIALWLILKVTGIINTPLWIQYSPLFGAIYLAGWSMHKLKTATDNIKDMKTELKDIDQDRNILKNNCPHLNKN